MHCFLYSFEQTYGSTLVYSPTLSCKDVWFRQTSIKSFTSTKSTISQNLIRSQKTKNKQTAITRTKNKARKSQNNKKKKAKKRKNKERKQYNNKKKTIQQ